MLLIKIGWSLIAPKNTDTFNTAYLQNLYQIIQKYPTIITHGTGNVGHGFIQQYGLSAETFAIWRTILDGYFHKIDNICSAHHRLRYDKNIDRSSIPQNTIISGDISQEYSIISSDRIFAEILAHQDIDQAIMLTDVDGVLDDHNNIISTIDQANIDTIHFREKPGDVNGSMQEKVSQLIHHNTWSHKKVWICNGNNLANLQEIITLGKGIGTCILL